MCIRDRVKLLAADLDPHGVLAPELEERAMKLGIEFEFRQGDLTEVGFRDGCAAEGPFDMALFVGLSSWFPKPATLSHLRWLKDNLKPEGRLITDCFTPAGYSLSGRYVGYKAHYYSPRRYCMLLEAAGFDGLNATAKSGRDAINHVVLCRPAKKPVSIAPQIDRKKTSVRMSITSPADKPQSRRRVLALQ